MSEPKAQPTPGPWRISSYDHGVTWKVETEEGRRAVASYVAGLRGEHEANARLIAAAPDLLDALKDARRQLIALCSPDDVPDSVQAAIRKAEGR